MNPRIKKYAALTACTLMASLLTSFPASAADNALAGSKNITYPADVLAGLKRWHLTLPTNKARQPFPADQIEQPGLSTFSNEYFKLNEAKTAVVFTSLFGGATTTAGTAFARSELRERNENGELAAWNCATAVRSMTLRQRIIKTPVHKPEMSVGQIHDAKNDNLEIFYAGPKSGANGTSDTGKVYAKINGESTSAAGKLDDEYKIGDMMAIRVSTREGKITVDYKNERTGKTTSVTKPVTTINGACFFKAGNYHQACLKENIYGSANPNCAKKSYSPDLFETDPYGTSAMEIYALSLDD